MPSVRYFNQTAPFWDFVANLEERGSSHPFFADRRGEGGEGPSGGPWSWGWGWGPHPHRPGPHHGPHGHHGPRGPPGPHPPPGDSPPGPPPPPMDGPAPPDPDIEAPSAPPPNYEDPQPPNNPEEPPHQRRGCHGRRGRCGGPRGRWGGWGRGPTGGAPFTFDAMANFLNSQLFENDGEAREGGAADDFKPDADVFDTETAFVIDLGLPGAKREDVGVNWDQDKSELSIAGVVYRNGDEDFLKTLAMDERKVGAFERKVRLGSRASPAQVDADMITAKLEEGVLRITVPKLDKDYVEVKKVDIE